MSDITGFDFCCEDWTNWVFTIGGGGGGNTKDFDWLEGKNVDLIGDTVAGLPDDNGS